MSDQTIAPSRLVAGHSPNVWAFSYRVEGGTVVTIFKSTPGDTEPRLQMTRPGCPAADLGAIDRPDRFGRFDTLTQFKRFVEAFRDDTQTR